MSAIALPRRHFIVEPRAKPSALTGLLVPAVSLLGAALIGAVFLQLTGHAPLSVYVTMIRSAVGSWRDVTETLNSAIPLVFTGCAAAIAFKMLVWNIGGEGQFYLGAIFAAGIALAVGEGNPPVVSIPLVLAAGAVGGALWAMLAAIPRALLGTNEIITTLMLNYVGLHLMNYLIFGSASLWRDPTSTNFPQGRPIPSSAQLPILSNRLHYGLFVALAVAALLWWALRATKWGFELRVVGDSPSAARYAGISVRRKVLWVLCLSGALAGLGGAVEVSGVVLSLEPRALAAGLGFTGIIVAALARLSPLAIIPVAVLIGALDNAGSALQIRGVPYAIVLMLQGAILFFAVGGDFLRRNRLRWARYATVRAEEAA